MGTLAKWEKQPAEVLDYDISFTDFLVLRPTYSVPEALITSIVVESDPGITIESSSHDGRVVKLWVSGGLHGWSYKITVLATINTGIIKSAEITIKVRDL
jgi:hypothetical protein